MNTRAITFACLVALHVALGGCGSDDPTISGDPAVISLEGQVLSDAWDEPLPVPVHVRIFRADGTGGWNEITADGSGDWSMEVELRDGCEPGGVLEAAAWITARDHMAVDEDMGSGRPVFCGSEVQTLEYALFREIFREPVPVAGGLQASQVSGYGWTCAAAEGGAFCWGADDAAPIPVPGGGSFQAVEVGFHHTCALDDGGGAWCWGSNINGVLGVPGLGASSEPVPVQTDLVFAELAANFESTCGRDAGGRLHCWGMYGDDTPVPFGGDLRFEQISGNVTHMCGIEAGTGQVWCWGDNSRGQLAMEVGGRSDEPVMVEEVAGADLVATGYGFTCALGQGGALHCWGWNCDGQFGRVGGPANDPVPQVVPGAPPLVRMALGLGFTCGLTEQGEAWCWGLNSWGQLGNATEFSVRSVDPVPVSGERHFTRISAGFRSACGITEEGELYCWGSRPYLGSGLPPAPGAVDALGAPAHARTPWSAEALADPAFPVGGSCLAG
jgi:alpha-tubulin suppressor-like RCC1 family protein